MQQNLAATLATLASQCLKVPASQLGAQVPLSRYGLDSLATVEMTAALERLVDRQLPDSLLIDYPDLQSLEIFLTSIPPVESPSVSCVDQMQRDSTLPHDIRPSYETQTGRLSGGDSSTDAFGTSVLLTGATGFLGSHLLRSLLTRLRCRIYCLARPQTGSSGLERIRETMRDYGLWDAEVESRIDVVEGDLSRPCLGLDEARFAALCHDVSAVYHSAAAVNWVCSYQALRSANVVGTRELLRFACTDRPKPFHFISTISVCYSTNGPREVYEDDELFSYRQGIHLGYAQSKLVGEALVRQAGERGLPIGIYRASLLTGDRSLAIPNSNDLLSRLIKSTVQMGEAPDLDWKLDCCPVDHVAEAIVNLASQRVSTSTFHLVNPRPRHWRELVLWMNLFGYRVQLCPYRRWLQRLEREAVGDHPLRELLPFFAGKPTGEGGLTLPELFEERRRSHVDSDTTRRILQAWPLPDPELDARLIDRYFQDFIDRGFLPEVHDTNGNAHAEGSRDARLCLKTPRTPALSPGKPGDREGTVSLRGNPCCVEAEPKYDTVFFTRIMRQRHPNDSSYVTEARRLYGGSEYSIISELTSWRHGSAAGLARYQVTVADSHAEPKTIGVVVKTKAKDTHVIDVAKKIAGQCSPELGRAFERFGHRVGFAGSHLRELAIYQQEDRRFQRYSPHVFGTVRDDHRDQWVLVLEDISDLDLLDTADDISGWSDDRIETVLRDLAQLHSIWYRRERELLDQPWLGPVTGVAQRAEMHELWTALAEFAAAAFGFETGSDMRALQHRLVSNITNRSARLEQMPRTLIHNDFNPRNVALRRAGTASRLCAYDWELATIGVPQRDLAEFLCFVLTTPPREAEVRHYLDLHRSAIEQAAKTKIDAAVWELGFRLSLQDLLIDRISMYAMVDRFRPQRFLGRVVSTWRALYDLFFVEETD